MSSQSNTQVIATVLVGVIIVLAFVGYGYYATSSSLASLSKQNVNLSQQLSGLNQQNSNLIQQAVSQNQQISSLGQQVSSQNQQISGLGQQVTNGNQQVSILSQQVSTLEQRTLTVVTMTNTVISVQTTTSVSTATDYVTNTVYSTVTTTSNVYPPSISTYPLTYVTGNATLTNPSCGNWVVAVDVTYEMHQQISPNIIQWAQFPSGQLMQPATQKSFINQAYLTIYDTYDYTTSLCGIGAISSLHAFVTDTNNNQLSPSTFFIVQGG